MADDVSPLDDAPTLVLLHPFPFDSRVFAELVAALAPYRVLTPDLRGNGEPALDELADQVIARLDDAHVDRAVLGGVSMGGYITLNLLRRYPGRCVGVVLIDTKSDADAAPALANRAGMAERADHGVRPDPAALLVGMLSPVTHRDRPKLVAELAAVIDSQPLPTVAWNQRAMAARPDSAATLAATPLPVLVVVGADDTITPPAVARSMAEHAAHSTVVEIADAGHLAVTERPAAVAAAISGWLDAVGLGAQR